MCFLFSRFCNFVLGFSRLYSKFFVNFKRSFKNHFTYSTIFHLSVNSVLVCCQFVASDQRRAGPQGRRYQSGGIAAIEKISYESGLGHVRLRRGGLFPLLARGEPGKAFPAGRLY